MIQPMPTWETKKPEAVNEAEIPTRNSADPRDWSKGFQVALNILLTVLLVCVIGTAGWYGHVIFSAPEFSKAKAHFEASGHPAEGERMAELGKICRDDLATPLACEALYFQRPSETTMVAQKP